MDSTKHRRISSEASYSPIECCRSMRWWEWLLAVLVTIVPLAGGFVGARLFNNGSYKRDEFAKPDFAPPSWAFSPGWIISYLCMGIGFVVLVKCAHGIHVGSAPAIILWLVQLVACWCWTPLLFGFAQFTAALVDASVIWALVFGCLITFPQHSKVATCLMVPVFVWISYALVLNYSLVQLNPINNSTVLG